MKTHLPPRRCKAQWPTVWPSWRSSTLSKILWEETCRFLPSGPRSDTRIGFNPLYRASAARTWRLYHEFKALGAASLGNIWAKWRAYAAFSRASKQLKQQSRQLKTAFHQEQLQRAETAAAKGDQRGLFQVLRTLAPKRARTISRM